MYNSETSQGAKLNHRIAWFGVKMAMQLEWFDETINKINTLYETESQTRKFNRLNLTQN